MGTSYYIQEQPPCETCGRPFEDKHIGKSSAGWCFALRVYPDEGINDLPAWQEFWKGKVIIDQHGRVVSEERMLSIITERGYAESKGLVCSVAPRSQPGPRGLLRFRIDGWHCVGHGEGTWDLLVSEFS